MCALDQRKSNAERNTSHWVCYQIIVCTCVAAVLLFTFSNIYLDLHKSYTLDLRKSHGGWRRLIIKQKREKLKFNVTNGPRFSHTWLCILMRSLVIMSHWNVHVSHNDIMRISFCFWSSTHYMAWGDYYITNSNVALQIVAQAKPWKSCSRNIIAVSLQFHLHVIWML